MRVLHVTSHQGGLIDGQTCHGPSCHVTAHHNFTL